MVTVRILGITDDVTVCDKCGKQNLKRTVVLEFADGSTAHYGCDCAARAMWNGKKAASKETRSLNYYGEIIERVNGWIASGYTLEVCCKGLRNKYGFPTDLKGGKLTIQFSATYTHTFEAK